MSDPAHLRSLQIVIPLFDEAEVLPTLLARIDATFTPAELARIGVGEFEVLFVDDGSRDGTAEAVCEHVRRGGRAMLVRLSRNFGHQAAVDAGLRHSTADLVAVMDADLQDPPEVVREMVARVGEGFDVVHARRVRRSEGPLLVACYWVFYRLLAVLADTDVAIDSGDFCVMTRRVVDAVCALPERLRFVRGLRSWVGFRQTTIPYERPARQAGVSKYPLRKLYALATDGIASTSVRPLKIAQLFTFALAVLLVILCVVLTIRALGNDRADEIETRFLWTWLLISMIGFMLMSSLYIMCGYLRRMYLEVKGRPTYVVMETFRRTDAGTTTP